MSNVQKDNTSNRNNASEFEQSAANKKKNSASNIFGTSDFEQSAVNKKKRIRNRLFLVQQRIMSIIQHLLNKLVMRDIIYLVLIMKKAILAQELLLDNINKHK